ncbi:MAG TPA: N-acetylmuramoyl-L-alanine amidase [Chthoniobacterales bacterium]
MYLVFFGVNHVRLSGQATDEEKRLRDLFLKSRQQMEVVPSPTPNVKPTPAPAPKPVRKPSFVPGEPAEGRQPSFAPSPTRSPARPLPGPKSEGTPEAAAVPTPTGSPSAAAAELDDEMTEESATPVPTATAAASAAVTPRKRHRWFIFGPHDGNEAPKSQARDNAIVIEKSSGQSEQEVAPVPNAGADQWHYLTPALRRAIDEARVARGRWKYIVVHNSGTREGNARIFDYYHRRVRRMTNGLAYHFVIGNGSSSGNGQVEIGDRWTRQLAGGHVHSDYLNYIGLGICLVGDFNRDMPTEAQYQALDELIRYLRQRVGKVDGKYAIVLGHREINPRPTDCPGSRFPLNWLHHTFPD